MPVHSVKRGDKYRVVEVDSGRIATNATGTPLDGGGHRIRLMADRQSRAVNRSVTMRAHQPSPQSVATRKMSRRSKRKSTAPKRRPSRRLYTRRRR
jgi:hypothetical protein